jgi:nucleoside-diphosphate-sugar epimerase
MSINELAELVKKIYEKKYSETVEIVKTVSDDNRSYHINSDKISELLNFKPQFSIDDAVESLFYAFENIQLGDTFFNDIYYNVKRMQNLKIK